MTEILIENEQDKLCVTEEMENAIRAVCNGVLVYEECDFDAQISVTLTDDENIHALNRQHRGVDHPTDVLSFPMMEFDSDGNALDSEFDYDDELVVLGDIVISVETAAAQAKEFGHSLLREIAFLTAHSMLHLLGYDHVDDDAGDALMRKKQTDILNKLGFTREK